MKRFMVVVVVSLTACGGFDAADVAQRATASLQPFKKELKAALMGALAKGPEAAVEVCANEAPAIAKRASHDGVMVGRTALRLRNAGNVPPPWAEAALPSLTAARVFDLGGGRAGYLEPIKLDEVCTTCHGTAVAPALLARIKERYPGDQATGFAVGDVRGAFWVELAASR